MSTDKRSCIARAEKLLENPTAESLRYAALELRLCIEALTYEKLRAFSNIVPESVLRTWQPPQAVKALLQFEPTGDQTFSIAVGIEDVPGVAAKEMHFVGKHTALKLNWLRKHYNKLGSLLHAPAVVDRQDQASEKTVAYLKSVVADLVEPLQGNITGGSIRQTISFECVQCKKPVIANREAAAKSKAAVCFNPQCGAEYHLQELEDGEVLAQLKCTEFDCHKCNAPIRLENRKIDIGLKFSCSACGEPHYIANRQWLYGPVEN